jgi:two-component system sensor histidine kinase VicK
MERLGILQLFVQYSASGAIIKIICPAGEDNNKVFHQLLSRSLGVRVKYSQENASPIMLIVDSRKLLLAEQKDTDTLDSLKSIDFAIYSNSKRIVTSFKSFFNLLWNQYAINEKLRQQESLQQEFINSIAHELRTPLQPILGITEQVKDKIADKKQKELLEMVIKSGRKLHLLTENILDITRIEGNIFKLKKEIFSLNQLVVDIGEDYSNSFEEVYNANKKIRIEINSPEREFFIHGDRNRIGQVISNLIDNSTKFIQKEGLISITIRETDSNNKKMITVIVKDNGEGIDPEIFPRLFTKFASKSSYGTGLGLYICKKIVESHGGQIVA